MVYYERRIDEDIVLLIILDFFLLIFICYCLRMLCRVMDENNIQE